MSNLSELFLNMKTMSEDDLKQLSVIFTPPNLPLHNLGDPYEMIHFVDHVIDTETGKIVKKGTPISRRTIGYMDEALYHLYLQVFTLYKLFKLLPLDESDYQNPYFNQLPVDGGSFTTTYANIMVIDCGGFDTGTAASASVEFPVIDGGDFNDEGLLDFIAATAGRSSALDGGTF